MPGLAILSDIHANLEALTAVLRDVDAHAADQVICLGDVIGYGPQPQECCDLLRRRGATLLQGNHEQGLISIHSLCHFNQPACDALRRTRQLLSEETFAWLVAHPKSLVAHGCRFVHGAPPDSVRDYIWQYEQTMAEVFARFREAVCFVGHTHDLMRFTCREGRASGRLALPEGETRLEPDRRHLVNIGSVGQPRDGDNRAKYALYRTESRVLTMRFIPYDIQKTADLILARGFHRAFAERLY